MSALLLFDIDGTLLLSGGAGVRAMGRAFESVFGVSDAFAGIHIAGYTDTFLLSRALTRAGLADTADAHTRFRETYLEMLPEEILKPGKGPKSVMPGVRELLDAVSAHDAVYTALLTGNYEAAADIKLRHFGIGEHFTWGAFGEESADRNELGRVALARAAERAVPRPARENVAIIGDTPHDIACAHAVGARAIAVATGNFTVDQLKESGADAVFADLGDTEAVLTLLL